MCEFNLSPSWRRCAHSVGPPTFSTEGELTWVGRGQRDRRVGSPKLIPWPSFQWERPTLDATFPVGTACRVKLANSPARPWLLSAGARRPRRRKACNPRLAKKTDELPEIVIAKCIVPATPA